MGDMVDELRAQSITCVSSLDNVTMAPDIIIGNTQIETVLCLAQFPGVPVISICDDRVAQHGSTFHIFRVSVLRGSRCKLRGAPDVGATALLRHR